MHKSQSISLIGTGVAARMLAVSPDTVRRWVKEGKISVVELPSGRLRFRRNEIEDLLKPTSSSVPSVLSANSVSDSSSADKSFDQPLPGFEGLS